MLSRDAKTLQNIRPLTALRAFFAIWVLAFHWFHLYPVAPTPFFDIGFTSPLFDKGYLGVDGFFILSGFILAYNYGGLVRRLDYRDFVVNRIARIYPVHLICLGLAIARIMVKEALTHRHIIGTPGNTWWELIANILLVNSWFPWQKNGWNDVAWSVSAEWFAYLAFPLFMVASRPRHPGATVAATLLLFGTLWLIESSGGATHLSVPHGLARIIPEFYLGTLVCRLRHQLPVLATIPGGSILSLLVVLAGVFCGSDTVAVAGLAGLILGLASDHDFLRTIMSVRPLIYLGEISYCIYLVQRTPQNLWDLLRQKVSMVAAMPFGLSVFCLFALTILSASMLHHLVEIPARRLLKKVLVGGAKVRGAVGRAA